LSARVFEDATRGCQWGRYEAHALPDRSTPLFAPTYAAEDGLFAGAVR
jgi:hypothetical protein